MNFLKAITVFILMAVFGATTYAYDNENKPPEIVSVYIPRYPVEQMISLTEGKVIIRLIVTKKGEVKDPEVVESEPKGVFDKAALKAVARYIFEPAVKDGNPIDSIVKVPVNFSISDPDEKIIIRAKKENAKGLKYMKAGKYKKAIKKYTEAIYIFKQYIPAYAGRGNAYMSQGKYSEAVSDFDKAINLAPEVSSYYSSRGQAYSKLGNIENMCLDLKKACELDDCSGLDRAVKAGKCSSF